MIDQKYSVEIKLKHIGHVVIQVYSFCKLSLNKSTNSTGNFYLSVMILTMGSLVNNGFS